MENYEKLRKEFYEFFKDGYQFEIFLKEFLKDLGFTDIKVTKKSKDGGIDLICYKDVISGINTINSEKFIVQAKKYKATVPPKDVRALNGTMYGARKLFITTSKFSDTLRVEVEKEMPQLSLIDGKDIIEFYVQNKSDKFFDWTPKISLEKLKEIIDRNTNDNVTSNNEENVESRILRVVSKNDLRARILRIPKEIFEQLGDASSYDVVVDGHEKNLHIIRNIKSFAGVTEFYKKRNYFESDRLTRNSYWSIDLEKEKIYVELEGI